MRARSESLQTSGFEVGSPGRIRTSDPTVNSRLLYRLSYRGARAKDLNLYLVFALSAGIKNVDRSG